MYAFIENNQIIQTEESLPSSWRNISGLNLLSDVNKLKQLGWYQVIFDEPVYDIETQTIAGYNYIYNEETDSAHRVAIIDLIHVPTQEELDQQLLQKRQRMICTNYQARAILIQYDLYNAVQDVMNDSNVDPTAKIAWEYAMNFYRISPFIASMSQILNFDDEQLDNLFEQAMEIKV